MWIEQLRYLTGICPDAFEAFLTVIRLNQYKLAILLTYQVFLIGLLGVVPRKTQLKRRASTFILVLVMFMYVRIDFDGPFYFEKVNLYHPEDA